MNLSAALCLIVSIESTSATSAQARFILSIPGIWSQRLERLLLTSYFAHEPQFGFQRSHLHVGDRGIFSCLSYASPVRNHLVQYLDRIKFSLLSKNIWMFRSQFGQHALQLGFEIRLT